MNTYRCSICEELGETCMECQPGVDAPQETGHAIPQWLRDRFDAIEREVRKIGAEGVFTQMRTKVQAYFEIMRSVERGKVGRDQAIIIQQKNLITSLRNDLQEAIAIDCEDDAIDACTEVERSGTPGSVIREMNDELADLRDENERARMRIKELDLLFGRYLLGMRASVIEWQHGEGAAAAMQWIWNGLAGPGELPPEDETQAQAYFDREIAQVESGMEEVARFFDARRAAKRVTP